MDDVRIFGRSLEEIRHALAVHDMNCPHPRDPVPVLVQRETGPISREDVEDFHGGVAPEGRQVL